MGCTNHFPLSRRFERIRGRFGPKKAFFGHKMRNFDRASPDLAPPPRAATLRFLAQNLDLARAWPRLQDSYGRVEPEALERSNGRYRKEKCCLLAWLLACCSGRFKKTGVS